MRFLVLLALSILLLPSAWSAPALEREVPFRGEVLEYTILSSELVHIEPAMTLYRLRIRLDPSCQAAFPEEPLLVVYSRQPLPETIFGHTIEGSTFLAGDERGSLHWLVSWEEKK